MRYARRLAAQMSRRDMSGGLYSYYSTLSFFRDPCQKGLVVIAIPIARTPLYIEIIKCYFYVRFL